MNQEHFLIELKLNLVDLPQQEVLKILSHYQEKFRLGLEAGKSEEQIAKELGHPSRLAATILSDRGLPPHLKEDHYSQGDWVEFETQHKAPKPKKDYPKNSFSPFIYFVRAVFIIGVNLVILSIPIVSLLFLLFGAWISGIVLIFAPVVGILGLINVVSAATLFQLFISILLCGLGLFITVICYFLTSFSLKLFRRYFSWSIRMISGGSQA